MQQPRPRCPREIGRMARAPDIDSRQLLVRRIELERGGAMDDHVEPAGRLGHAEPGLLHVAPRDPQVRHRPAVIAAHFGLAMDQCRHIRSPRHQPRADLAADQPGRSGDQHLQHDDTAGWITQLLPIRPAERTSRRAVQYSYNAAMAYTHDAIVIGAGSAGLTAAGGLAMFGLKPALVEMGEMGGECLNTGCVPSKAMLAAAERAHEMRGDALGVSANERRVDFAGVRAHVHGAIAAVAPHDSQERFEGMGVEVIRARARLVGGKGAGRVLAGNRELAAPRIVIATGSRPAIPPVEGLDGVPYLTNETLWDLAELPSHLAIIGAGAVGCEMAQAFRRLGSQVTVVAPGRLLARDDEEAAALVKARLEAEGVRFLQAKAGRIEGEAGAIRLTASTGEEVTATHLLVAAGRQANTENLGLEAAGVEVGEDGIVTDERRRTANRRIYAIGDCRAGPRFTHVSGYEGSNVVMEIALGVPAKVDYRALPHATYTDPELAQVGLTEAEARERYGSRVTIEREDFAHNDRAIAEGRAEGFAKLVTAHVGVRGGKVVGTTIVGRHAGELLVPYSQLITGKASTFSLGSAIIAYPTRSEISKALAFAYWQPTVFGRAGKGWASIMSRLRRIGG